MERYKGDIEREATAHEYMLFIEFMKVETEGGSEPNDFVVGYAAGYAKALQWGENKALNGKKKHGKAKKGV